MIRLRSQKLLSGVSGLAVLASFGLVSPALAAPTYPGPTNYDPIVNDQSGAGSTVLIGPDATVRANATTNDSFFNNLTMTGAGIKLRVQDSYLLGDIENTGTMQSSTADGISIDSDSQIDGRIFNSGLIQGVGAGIEIITDSTVAGGINNTGSIIGTSDGISLGLNSEIFGGIVNSGRIVGTADAGIDIDNANAEFFGGIINNGGATITGADAGIEFNGTIFSGGVNNTGSITGGDGIDITSGTFGGGVTNNAAGFISGSTEAGILIRGTGFFNGNITNSGVIQGTLSADGIRMRDAGAVFTGNIVNNQTGVIQMLGANDSAIDIAGGTFTGNITNSGQILADATNGIGISVSGAATVFTGNITNNSTGLISADASAIAIGNGTFTGTITNNGSISSDDQDGIHIANTVAFVGNVVNNGVIAFGTTTGVGDDGVEIDTVTFTGSVTNSSTGTILASGDGMEIDFTTFTGNVTNAGVIGSTATAVGEGIDIDGTTMTGSVSNSGTIISNDDTLDIDVVTLTGNITNSGYMSAGSTGDGINVGGTAATLTGSVTNTNSGTILAGDQGIEIGSGQTITGDVTNAGTIIADDTGILVDGVIQGSLVNTGKIDPVIGMDINGTVVGGIFTSGDIIATQTGIDVSGATGLHTITQSAGLIQGRTADNLTITNALNLSNAFADTFNANGGTLDGNVVVNATDDFIMNPSGTFTWRRGATTGTLDQFDMNGGGTAILGGASRGDATGEGVTVNAATMTFGGEGRIYLDDDTTINAGTFSQTDGTLEFFVTSDTTQHNYITSGAALTLTNIRGAVYIDPNTMALGGGQTLYQYNDVIDGTGARVGALPNGGTLTTSSIFFTGTFVGTNDTDDLDIELNRLAFDAALAAAGATETQNQQAVAAALEEIYDNGFISPEMEGVFIDLFTAGLTPAQIQFILNELSGSEIAQAEQVSLSVANIFNNLVEERLDSGLLSLGGTRMSALAQQRYADAGTTATDGSHGMTRGGSGMSVWARGFGQWVNVDTDPEADGYDQDSNGLIGGIDYAPNANAMVGGAVAYTDTDVDFDEPGDTADVESWQVGLYGSYGFGKFYVDGTASYGWHDVTGQRTISLPSNTYVASSAYDASAWSVQGELGAIWRLGRVNMQPSVALGYTGADRDGFSETVSPTAPGLGLVVGGSDSDSLATTLALRASGEWMMGKTQVVPDIKLGWRHEFEDGRQDFTANFFEDLTSAASMTIVSSEIQADSLVVSTGATFGVTKNFEVFIDVNGQYNADASATNASGGVRLTW